MVVRRHILLWLATALAACTSDVHYTTAAPVTEVSEQNTAEAQ